MENPPSPHSGSTEEAPGLPGPTVRCPVCGQEVSVSAMQEDSHLTCTQCGAELVPEDMPSEYAEEEVAPATQWAAGAGLIASLFIHTLLLCAFMVITWQSDNDGRKEEGIDVGIVSEDETPDIVAPKMDPIRYEGEWAEMSPAIASGMAELESLGDPETLASSLQSASPVGLEIATGGLSGLEGDFAGLGSLGAGAGGSARFFGLVARGRKFVYVVDYSSSMHGERMEDAKAELIRSINNLPRFAEFYVFFYNQHHAGMPAEGLVRATPENKKQYTGWINGVQPSGGTNPTSALLEALKLGPDAIWLLSDGEFDSRAALSLQENNKDLHVQVHTIAFHSEGGKELLQRIAQENEGRYRFVRSRDDRDSVRTRIHRR